MQIKIVTDGNLPQYQTAGSAGLDLCASLKQTICILPSERCLVPTGIRIAIPEGYEGQVRSRSSLALKHGVIVLNSPGTIDSDYRGEILVILHNASQTTFLVANGDRIAQIVFAKYERIEWAQVMELDSTARLGGFGSTGK